MRNIHTSQRETTTALGSNSKDVCNRRNLENQIALALRNRANAAREWRDEETYKRYNHTADNISKCTTAELQQYAKDLGIFVFTL